MRDASDEGKTGPLKALGVGEIVSLDVTNPEQIEAATKGTDLLFHEAATDKLFTGDPDADRQMIADSIEGTRSAFKAAKANGVAKIVMTSSTVTVPLTARGAC